MHRGMQLICIAEGAGRCIRRRQVYLFPTEAPLHRSSPAVSGKTIHPHTCIRNEIISLPPWAVISQARCLDGPSHTPGDAEEKELGEVWNRYSRAAGQTGKYTVPERAEDEKRVSKEINGAGKGELIANVLRNRTEAKPGKNTSFTPPSRD